MKTLAILLVATCAFALAALQFTAADESNPDYQAWDPPIGPNEPAEPIYDNGQVVGYNCWNPHGYPIPQEQSVCPDGWAGRAPERPFNIDWNGDGIDNDAGYWDNVEGCMIPPCPEPTPTPEPVAPTPAPTPEPVAPAVQQQATITTEETCNN